MGRPVTAMGGRIGIEGTGAFSAAGAGGSSRLAAGSAWTGASFRIAYGLRLRLSVRNGRAAPRARQRRSSGSALGCRPSSVAKWKQRILVSIVAAQFEYHVVIKGAGVRLFICNAEFGEFFEYFMSFDFQLSRQLVNSDLSHR